MTNEIIEIDLAKIADEETKAVQLKFPDYMLIENPFPSSAIASRNRIFFGRPIKFRTELFMNIARRVVHTARSGRYNGMVVLGDFGLGKSYTLYYFNELINKQLGDKEGAKSLALYISAPGTTLNDFLSDFLEEIDIDIFFNSIFTEYKEGIRDIFKSLYKESLPSENRFRELYYMRTIPWSEIISNLDEIESLSQVKDIIGKIPFYRQDDIVSKLSSGLAKLLVDNGDLTNPDFSYCLSLLIFSNSSEDIRMAKKFIKGERLNATEIKKLGLMSNQLSPSDISRRIFPDLLRILNTKGEKYNMIFVFIDEFERIISSLKGAKRFEYLEDFRTLIDYNLNQFSLILGCTPDAYDAIKGTSPAFADRNRDILDLPRITSVENIRDLLEMHMNEKRVSGYDGDEIYPFNNESLSIIIDQERGSPRYILEACHKILIYALNEGADNIDKELVGRWYGK